MALAGPRLLELDRVVTPDEHKWLRRSGNFYQALLHGELANTYQREHPGVTIMWAGTAALLVRCPDYARNAEPQLDIGQYLRALTASGCEQLDVLVTSRLILVLAGIASLLLAFVYASRLLGPTPALAGSLLLAFDPFHAGHSRLFHLDGLLSSLVLLSLLAFLAYRQDRHPWTMAVSCVAFGLACLVKSTASFMIPAIGLVAGLDGATGLRTGMDNRLRAAGRGLWPAIAWGLGGLATILLLWPAMWVDPIGPPARVIGAAFSYAQTGHRAAVFFDDEIAEDGNLGADVYTFYPVTYAWRSTFIVLPELSDEEMQTVLDSDYAVIYIHEWQRRIPANLLARLERLTPDHSVWIDGLEYARIYDLRDLDSP